MKINLKPVERLSDVVTHCHVKVASIICVLIMTLNRMLTGFLTFFFFICGMTIFAASKCLKPVNSLFRTCAKVGRCTNISEILNTYLACYPIVKIAS